jgi:NAD(P)-dependent dehydrogenase (short-subunit alcohol dehydrogenase family)
MDLSGKVTIVTGAGGNLGSCMSKLLAARNARLVLSDINEKAVGEVCDQIRQQGGQAMVKAADVTKENDLRDLMDVAASEFGGIDVLVNNAGLLGQEHGIGLLDLEIELWDRTIDINLRSVYLASKCAMPHLIKRGGGSIINISSAAALGGYHMLHAYGTSKGGVNTLTKYIATAYGKDNVRCNAVLPGLHLSEEAKARTSKESLEGLAQHCMLPRLGLPDDVAKVVAFLASDDAYYVTAQLISVDGGFVGHLPHLADARRSGELYRSAQKPG